MGTIGFVGGADAGTATTTTFSITLPTTQANDLIILEYTHRGTGAAILGGTYTGPTFQLKANVLYAGNNRGARSSWSRATGDHNGETITGSGLSNSCAAIVTIYRSVTPVGDPTIVAGTAVAEDNIILGDETSAEITTVAEGALVLFGVANTPGLSVTAQSCTSPGALTLRREVISTGGLGTSIAHASAVKATPGVTGEFTWSQSNSPNGSWAYALAPESEQVAFQHRVPSAMIFS